MRINRALLEGAWTAAWVVPPEGPLCDFGVFHFRKKLHISEKPESFIIHISGDNRYRFFVNGYHIGRGPCRGDMNRWYFETYDIAPFLKDGTNILAAVVWNFGILRPIAQVSFQTRLIVQGNTEAEQIVDTRIGNGWKVFYNRGYTPYLAGGESYHLAVGPGEKIDGCLYPWGWEKDDFDDSLWSDVKESFPRAYPRENRMWGTVSYLVPRPIPFMTEERRFFQKVALSEGIEIPAGFLDGEEGMFIPPGREISIIFDNGVLTTGYPEIEVSEGKGASIILCYAESLWKNGEKGNRNEVEGKEIRGLSDYFLPDGGRDRTFGPLWWRAFRYMQMKIVTADHPIRIKKLSYIYTGYPFREKGKFESDRKELKKIWDTGWRTARLCAHETYLDCPYYEQLQYVGDTRIQALISLYVSGDTRLMKKAIQDFSDSLLPDGLTKSQHPSFYTQVIPPFSLLWINMLNDYWWFRDDDGFVKNSLLVVRSILNWFEERMDNKTGLLGPLPWWNFVDWAKEYERGVPSGVEDGNSSVITLFFINALIAASEMESATGSSWYARRYKKLASDIKKAVMEQCWDEEKGLIADTPEKKQFSQHANVLAVLTGTIPRKLHKVVMEKVLKDPSLIQCTYYFQFYLHQAVKKAGLGDLYISLLEPWRKMLEMGLTTFAEKPEPTRSDCHAWSAHPNINLLAIVCGITPAEPGFRSVRIAPALGPLNRVKGAVPHPCGMIKVFIKKSDTEKIDAEITLPEGLTGVFVYGKNAVPLKSGRQVLYGIKKG
ncbi:MAG TPA: family 78 glycoside hydrolase catalytic domain [bacterium]|nr:family 78 glycoside hydrolase catalytic domain [bacterium]HPP29328.1 family 78 glycoside hydrolase catalytic domain [bacterium]